MWKDDATAADILLAARDIRRFTAGLSRDDFLKNRLVQFAVVNRITVMCEAAKRLSQEFRRGHRGRLGPRPRVRRVYEQSPGCPARLRTGRERAVAERSLFDVALQVFNQLRLCGTPFQPWPGKFFL
jgi:ribonuclease HepT-like protein